jgi:hypothetical protein
VASGCCLDSTALASLSQLLLKSKKILEVASWNVPQFFLVIGDNDYNFCVPLKYHTWSLKHVSQPQP